MRNQIKSNHVLEMYYKFWRFGPFGGHHRPFKKLETVVKSLFNKCGVSKSEKTIWNLLDKNSLPQETKLGRKVKNPEILGDSKKRILNQLDEKNSLPQEKKSGRKVKNPEIQQYRTI